MIFNGHWILWQNARNLLYIKWEEFLASKKLADSKLGTKKFLAAHKVAVPETLGIIKKLSENTKERILALEPPFVVKPNNGYGGKWILIVDEKSAEWNFITNSGEIYTPSELREHLNYILEWFFSLSGGRDRVIIEKKIILTKEIELFATYGLPDIRVIAYNKVPVMAMIRIPTKESDGKANIHGWACAAWIDIWTGKITSISHRGKTVKSVPGIGDIRGITIPRWDDILSLVVKVQKVTGIKFLGCDVVLDEFLGPLLLEMNIRPGLEIQNVNLTPLRERLDKLEGVDVGTIEKWVRLGRDLFSGDVEERIKSVSGKEVVGSKEYVKIWYGEKHYNYLSHIRISKSESTLGKDFAKNILKIDTQKRDKVRLECEILWIKRTIRFEISEQSNENIVLGKNALRGFLIDPFKYKKWENPILPESYSNNISNTAIKKTQESLLKEIDKKLFDIDKKLLILKYITPLNIEEQKHIFIEKKGDYIPRFLYPEIPFNLQELEKQLSKIEIPDIPFGEIFESKKNEIYHKIKYLIAFESQNAADMTLYSWKIFWEIEDENFEKSKKRLESRSEVIPEEEFLNASDIRDYLKKFNHIYGIKLKVVEADKAARFTMKGDSLMLRKWALVGKREIRSIVAHEVEWHYLRKLNGKKSSFSLLSRGWAWYLIADEWIAIYNQNRFLSPRDAKYYSIFERYYFVWYALKHSYRKLISNLSEMYDDDYARVFAYMLRLKRWFEDPSKSWVFMKDVVYVNGLFEVTRYLNTGWKLEDLYIWKLSIQDVETVKGADIFVPYKKNIVIPFSA